MRRRNFNCNESPSVKPTFSFFVRSKPLPFAFFLNKKKQTGEKEIERLFCSFLSHLLSINDDASDDHLRVSTLFYDIYMLSNMVHFFSSSLSLFFFQSFP
eukprot:TRINITY_DN15120_c0_g2_i3.p1 TRINITY_DN15120_c0_g2~~TRINITY_DN15120_c0_g2_i3.p1  ORF type:complete len:100 (-),score=3.64 TRINITY_DN15120_c0_g2_i3:1148-1447(-)